MMTWQRAEPGSTDPIVIRSVVAAAHHACPAANLENVVDMALGEAMPLRLLKEALFDRIAATHALRPGEVEFHRATFAAIIGATRRRA